MRKYALSMGLGIPPSVEKYNGAGGAWSVVFEPLPPSLLNDLQRQHNETHRIPQLPHPVIHCRDIHRAQEVAFMVFAAEALVEARIPGMWFLGAFHPYHAYPFDERELDLLYDGQAEYMRQQHGAYGSNPSIEKATRIAARASRRRSFQYALVKFVFSLHDTYIEPADLYPGEHDDYHDEHRASSHPADHIMRTRAIVGAYGVIEELGLDVRASSKEPALLPKRAGWNPTIKAGLERRLLAAGVDIDRTFPWHVRDGPRRFIEKETRERTFDPTPAAWAGGPVRDQQVTIFDAINVCSWMRSKVSAHKVSKYAATVTGVDVNNCQMVARRLLLESLDEWPKSAVDAGLAAKNVERRRLLLESLAEHPQRAIQPPAPVADQALTPTEPAPE
jgi:hypothetical protein